MALGKPLYDRNGRVLLAAGVPLNARFIEALQARGYTSVYVRDGLADDVAPADLISEEVRMVASSHLEALFTIVTKVSEHGEPRKPSSWPGETWRVIESLYRDVEDILDEVFASEAFDGMAAVKSHDSYTYEHSVETTVVGVMLGKRLGLQREDLRQLGLGCLLHDIGKRGVPTEVLNKPGPLTSQELAQVKEHPRIGFELIKSLDLDSPVPQHIAWQHHEKQDGTGYPRGLHGTNRVVRSIADLGVPGRIMLLAELAAVADVFSALASDRPFRPALPPEEVARTLRALAGSHLNREVVDAFFRVVPTFPMGLRVVLNGAPFDGWRGVVVAVHPSQLHRPVVRLLQDSAGREVPHAEIDLRRYPDVSLSSERIDSEAGSAPPRTVWDPLRA